MNNLRIGSLIWDKGRYRDAIHMAVAPVVAAENLRPGQHVGFVGDDRETVGQSSNPIGVVDPFLRFDVERGQRFWVFIYPNTVTSLRHEWTHPSFPAQEVKSDAVVARQWIESFSGSIGQTYDSLMAAARQWVEDEEYTYDNTESYKNHWDRFPEFWKNYEIVTGEKVKDAEATFFTCSC